MKSDDVVVGDFEKFGVHEVGRSREASLEEESVVNIVAQLLHHFVPDHVVLEEDIPELAMNQDGVEALSQEAHTFGDKGIEDRAKKSS